MKPAYTKKEREVKIKAIEKSLVYVFIITFVLIGALLITNNSSITGLFTYEQLDYEVMPIDNVFTNNQTLEFNVSNLVSLKVTGSLIYNEDSTFEIKLLTDQGELIVLDEESLFAEPVQSTSSVNLITGMMVSENELVSALNETTNIDKFVEEINTNEAGNTQDIINITNTIEDESININKSIKFTSNIMANVTENVSINSAEINKITNISMNLTSNITEINETINLTVNETLNITEFNISINETINLTLNISNETEIIIKENITEINKTINDSVNITINITEENITTEIEVNNTINETINLTVNLEQVIENLCKETCNLNSINAKSIIINVKNAELYIEKFDYALKTENVLPVQVLNFSDIVVNVNETINFSLIDYFEDTEELTFDYKEISSFETVLGNNILSITPTVLGEFNYYVYASDGDSLIQSNVFKITVVSSNLSVTNKTITDEVVSEVRINSPVNLVRKVKLEKPKKDAVIKLPEEAENIIVNKIVDNVKRDISDKVKRKDKETAKFNNLITGNLVSEINLNEIGNETELIIEETVEDVEIKYELPGPSAEEIEFTEYNKQIVVSSDIHYENIISYSFIDNVPEKTINLYHIVNQSRVRTDFDSYDTDEDGLVDYIEWIIPHLSNQTYEIEIMVLNPYSYLKDGDTWYVRFNTTGTANLTIWTNNSYWEEMLNDSSLTIDEMQFLNITCGGVGLFDDLIIIDEDNNSYNYSSLTEDNSIKPTKFFIPNYNCDNATGEFTNYMNIGGYALLTFEFANQNASVVDYAYDPDDWWNSSWEKRKEINITNVGSTTLTNFPAYLNVSKTGSMQADYDDLRFINGSCASGQSLELVYEIDYDDSNKADVWIKIPSLISGVNQICMYYNNSGASAGENLTGVWDNDYLMVQHLQETSGTHYDSTTNDNDGTEYIDSPGTQDAVGKIGGAITLDGVDDYIDLGDDADFEKDNFSIELWANRAGNSSKGGGVLFSKYYSEVNNREYYFEINNDQLLGFVTYDSAGTTSTSIKYSISDNWAHVAATKSGTSIKIYINGSLVNSSDSASTTIKDGDSKVMIGAIHKSSTIPDSFFNGTIDEVRYSNTTRTIDWINQSYHLVANQGTYVTFDTEEDPDNFAPSVSNVILSSSSATSTTDENLSIVITGSDSNGDVFTNVTDWRKEGVSIAVLNMPFDVNDSSTAKDYSTKNNDGTITTATWSSSGKVGGAYVFDGSADYINAGNDTSITTGLTSAHTFSAWVKTSYSAVIQRVIDNDYAQNSFAFFIGIDGLVAYDLNDDLDSWNRVTSTGSSIIDGEWHQITGVYDGSDSIIYIDGVEKNRTSITNPLKFYANNVVIGVKGQDLPSLNQLFNGSIDQVKIYNYSLSPEQINASYQAGLDNHSVYTIVSNETSVGDNWSVAVTPVDVYGLDGSTVLSNNLTIVDNSYNFEGWFSDYSYRKNITIIGQTGAGTNYQIPLEIGASSGGDFNLESHCINFPNDLRFTAGDGTTKLDYWIENVSANPITVWVKVSDDLESNQSIYIYYGKSGVSYDSNGTNTFEFFDDFELNNFNKWTSFDSWTIVSNVVKEGNYAAYVADSDLDRSLLKNLTLNFSYIETLYVRTDGSSTYGAYPVLLADESYTTVYSIVFYGGVLRYYQGSYVDWPQNNTYSSNTWYKLEHAVDFNSNKQKAWKDGNYMGEIDLKDSSGGSVSSVSNFRKKPGSAGKDALWLDQIYIRKYVSTEPAYSSVSSEESVMSPVMVSASISPTSPVTNNDLLGYCNATDVEGDNLSYYYLWYNGSSLFDSGVTSSNFTQGVEINVNNVSSSNTLKGETWKLSCLAFDGIVNASSWVNDSVVIQNTEPTAPTLLTPVSGVYNGSITITCSGSIDVDDDTIYYDITTNQSGSWVLLVNDDADGVFDWDISGLGEQSVVDLRCLATDTFGSSSDYNPGGVIELDSLSPRMLDKDSNHTTKYGDVVSFNVTFNDSNLDTCVFEYYNGASWSNTTNDSCVSKQTWTVEKTMVGTRDDVINWSWYSNDTLGQTNQTVYDSFILDNVAPSVSVVRISPTLPYINDILKGYCNASDADADNLSYYYRWYLDDALNTSGHATNSGNNFTQGIEYNINNLGSSYTTKGDNWTFSCLANDGIVNASSWVNDSVIVDEIVISDIKCYNGSVWVDCDNVLFGQDIYLQANCSSELNVDANFVLENVQDSSILINETVTSPVNSVFNTSTSVNINDSGNFTITVTCNTSVHSEQANDAFFIDWGVLVPYVIDPASLSMTVYQSEFFNVSVGVNCTIGECGNISAILDPFEFDVESFEENNKKLVFLSELVNLTEEERTWSENGVVLVNSEKPVYGSGEEVKLYVLVLDKDSYKVSNADVYVKIIDAGGWETVLTDSVLVEEGVYLFNYVPFIEGDYGVFVSAVADNVDNNFTSNFLVDDDVEFDIVRTAPIYLTGEDKWYDVGLSIEPIVDVGYYDVYEYVSKELDLSKESYVEGDKSVMFWNALTGVSVLNYSFYAPLIAPYLYSMQTKIVYEDKEFVEEREWSLGMDRLSCAEDCSNECGTQSWGCVESYSGGDCSGGGSCAEDCFTPNKFNCTLEDEGDDGYCVCNPFAASTQFVIGGDSESCDAACTSIGETCTGSWSDDSSCTQMIVSGADCSKGCYRPSGAPFEPFVDTEDVGNCVYGSTSNCSASHKNFDRLCQCTDSSSSCPGYDDGTYCWIQGSTGNSCDTVCSGEGSSCVVADWNDDSSCSVLKALGNRCSNCDEGPENFFPGYVKSNPDDCRFRGGGSQDCSAYQEDVARACACDIGDFNTFNNKSGVIPEDSGTPFYTTKDNPRTASQLSCLSDMKKDDDCNVTWPVNSTGALSKLYEFFVTFNTTQYNSEVGSNDTSHWNVSVRSRPYLLYNIPSQVWPTNFNNTALDLDYFFDDADNDDFNYSVSGNSNIAISIDNSTGIVTMDPSSWNGTETVNFTAYDEQGNTVTSNNILLNVTNDTCTRPSSGLTYSPDTGSRTRQIPWNITHDCSFQDQTIYMDVDQGIFVYGNLTFDNVDLLFNSSADSQSYFNSYSGSKLNITNSNITSLTVDNEFAFWVYVGTDFDLIDSYLSEMDGNGLTVYANNSIINNNTISLSYRCLRIHSLNNIILNNIIDSDSVGIVLISGSFNNTISGNNVSTLSNDAIYIETSNNEIYNNVLSTLGVRNYAISLLTANNNKIYDNSIVTTGGYAHGVYIYSGSDSNVVENNSIVTTGSGVFLSSISNCNVENNSIVTTGSSGDGIYLTTVSNSNIVDNTLNISSTNRYGINLQVNSDNNLVENNNIIYVERDAIYLAGFGSNYPNNNNFTNNTFNNIGGYDLNVFDAGCDYNSFIDQEITNYSIAGAGSILYFKDSDYGELRYLEAINGSGTNLSNDIKISSNLIDVNSSKSGLNKSANLTFYSVPVSGTLMPFRNGERCPSNICGNVTDLGSNNYWFNVTHFTNYSVGNNSVPTISSVTITPSDPTSSDDLNCTVSGWSDGDSDAEQYYFDWYNGSSLFFSALQSVTFNVIDSSDTTNGDVWNCTVTPYDGYDNGTSISDQVSIGNSPPETPVLITPTDNNYSLETRSPTFIWNSTDVDGDDLNFTIEINSSVCANYSYPDLNQTATGITYNYTIPAELCTEFEAADTVYTWRVKAYDGTTYSDWSETFNFSINDLLTIDILNDSIDFGSLEVTEEVDTETNADPFLFQNNGLVQADLINLSMNTSFWSSEGLGNEYLQFKCGNYSTNSTYNYSESVVTWSNFSSENLNVAKELTYNNGQNYLEVDLKLIVPAFEPPGSRQKEISFVWDLSNS